MCALSPPPCGEGLGVGVVPEKPRCSTRHHPHLQLLPTSLSDLGQARDRLGRRGALPSKGKAPRPRCVNAVAPRAGRGPIPRPGERRAPRARVRGGCRRSLIRKYPSPSLRLRLRLLRLLNGDVALSPPAGRGETRAEFVWTKVSPDSPARNGFSGRRIACPPVFRVDLPRRSKRAGRPLRKTAGCCVSADRRRNTPSGACPARSRSASGRARARPRPAPPPRAGTGSSGRDRRPSRRGTAP